MALVGVYLRGAPPAFAAKVKAGRCAAPFRPPRQF
jgi:hypothetical protein